MTPPKGKILHIGGPLDGQRRLWPTLKDGVCYSTPLITPVDMPNATACGITIDTYQLKEYREGEPFIVAVHSSVSNIMEALIKGYHRYHRRLTDEEKHYRQSRRLAAQATPPYRFTSYGKR